MNVDVHADSLAALMVLCPPLEPMPEPFRMQGDIWMYVNYTQYLSFVRSLPEESSLLYNSTAVLKDAMERQDDVALLKAFYTDMAGAVGKELSYAEAHHMPATHLRHTFDKCEATKGVTITPTAVSNLQSLLAAKGYYVGTISKVNENEWQYACKLLQEALNGPTRWVEKQ